jgi:catechol 2,3-dioxygenase-like lactoylglutathione lyase family enzyme
MFIDGELSTGNPTMTAITPESRPKPVLLAAEPQLFVADLATACEFYTSKLGFIVAFTYGEPAFYGQVRRDGATLNLRCVQKSAVDPLVRDRERLLSASITLDDAQPLFLEFQAAGVAFHQTPRTEPWGARTFIVRDPDGNLILFSGAGIAEHPPLGSKWSHMRAATEINNTRESLDVHNSDIAESRFSNAKLSKSSFDDVNLQRSIFTNTNLADATFADVNLTSVAIKDAKLTGMTINGVLVSSLIRAYESRAMAVLYAKNLATVQAFYQGVLTLEVEHTQRDHVILASRALQLVIFKVPEPIASTIEIADPPRRRSETPIKLVFEVANIAASRESARSLGGELYPAEREWTYQGYRVCDGQDPEGNVVQFRQREQ